MKLIVGLHPCVPYFTRPGERMTDEMPIITPFIIVADIIIAATDLTFPTEFYFSFIA